MKTLLTILIIADAISMRCFAQVKSQYLYNTSMPYGTLDIRTYVSSTYYYYLQENITFSFRESSPGVRTRTYLDMTPWESNQYRQGNLRLKNGTRDEFVMNYRILFPVNYNSTYAEGYPMIVLMHGAVERANCYYNSCYHSGWNYNPNVNSPPAPTSSTHKLLNNDHNLLNGGQQHLDARNLAGSKLPNDPTLATRAFPGFVVVPQMMNDWDSLSVQHMIRIVRLLTQKYKVDQNKIYIHGLSIGGAGVYQALKRASWLFAAALPMSAVRDGYIFKHNQQGKVAHIPLWVFQGQNDTKPSPAFTESLIAKFRSAGAIVRYSKYANYGHAIWNRAYSEPDFFTWMRSKTKANIHVHAGNPVIVRSKNQYPRLVLAEGFLAYQWERNGVIISGATSHTYTATTAGSYRARFSRISSVPSSTQWNKWSAAVAVTEAASAPAPTTTAASTETVVMEDDMPFAVEVYPNPSRAANFTVVIQTSREEPVQAKLLDPIHGITHELTFNADQLNTESSLELPANLRDGIYVLVVSQGLEEIRTRIMVKSD